MINIAEILKDCPKGTKLYSPLCGRCELYSCDDAIINVTSVSRNKYPSFNKFGQYYDNEPDSECLLFPSKENRDWSKFQRPFKDGDIVVTKTSNNFIFYSIYKCVENREVQAYVDYNLDMNKLMFNDNLSSLCFIDEIVEQRFATEEERQKLFDAIKANGYRWNAETKTLEKLVEPIFKVGNKVKYKNGKNIDGVEQGVILSITDDTYDVAVTNDMGIFVSIADQDDWELVLDIKPKFKVGDRVRNKNYKDYIYDIHDIIDKGYRAKEINADSPILILFGSQEDNYELVPNKFDITTLKPFESRVLIRDYDNRMWIPTFWGKRLEDDSNCRYLTTNGCYKYCIPYEQNEHLLGTTDDCGEYFKTWKNEKAES